MHRIDGAGHVNNTWVAEDPATNRPPTEITPEIMNALQEEIVNVIEPKLALDKNNNTQLVTAIGMMITQAMYGGDYKQSVRVATTAAINLAAPGASIDGVAMVAGNRFLEKDNATLAARGIYIWNGAAVAATRAADADNGAEFNSGAIIPVEEGTVNGNKNWQLTTDGTVTIGVTGLNFQEAGAASDATTLVKGLVKLATDALTQAGVDTLTAVTPASLSSRIATETRTGLVEKATPAEAQTFAADKFIDGALFGSVALGANQTWLDLTASRANAVTYTNSTGKPIQVLVSFADTNNSTATYTVNVGGVNIINALTYDLSGAYFGSSVASFIVPNGTTYAVSFTNANISKWSELR